jgi:DNA primase
VRNRERGTDTILYHRPDIPDLKVAKLPEGQDPDEIAIENPTAWRRLIEAAVPFMDFMFTALSSRFDLSSPEGKRDYAELLFPMVTAHANPFEQDQYVQRLAHMLGVSEQILVARMGHSRPARSRAAARRRRPEPVATSFERMEHDPLEEFCLSILLKHPEIVSRSSELGLEHFKRIENRELFTLWQKNVNINTMGESLDHELREHLEHVSSKELPPETLAEREAALEDCLHRLEERRLRELKVEEEMRLAAIPREDFLEEASHVLELNERLKRLYHMNPDSDTE